MICGKVDSTVPAGGVRVRRRNGTSLVEMLVVISLAGAISLVGTRIIIRFFQLDAGAAAAAARQLTLERLEDQFRQDVHDARAFELAEPDPQRQQLSLSLMDGDDVNYDCLADRVERTRRRGDVKQSREVFLLEDATVRIVPSERWLTLICRSHPESAAFSPVTNASAAEFVVIAGTRHDPDDRGPGTGGH